MDALDRRANIKVEVWDNAALTGQKAFQGKPKTSAARDFTVKIDATGPEPNTQYYYRFRKDDGRSTDVGTFKTAPDPSPPADVKFTYTGDSDPPRLVASPFNNFEALDAAENENGDFFVYLGDTIYSDSSFRPGWTGDDAGRLPRRIPGAAHLPEPTDLLESTSTYAVDGRPRGRQRLRRPDRRPGPLRGGRQAFMEYMPIRETGLLHDPSCAGDPLYRNTSGVADVGAVRARRACPAGAPTSQCRAAVTWPDTAAGDPAAFVACSADTRRRAAWQRSTTRPGRCSGRCRRRAQERLAELHRQAQARQSGARSSSSRRCRTTAGRAMEQSVTEILNYISNNGIDNVHS